MLIALVLGTLACEEERRRPGTTTRRDAGITADGGGLDGSEPMTSDASVGDDGGTRPTAPEVDPECLDGRYSEVLPEAGADLAAELAAYDASQLREFILASLEKRYPTGRYIVEGGLTNTRLGDCIQQFIREQQSGSVVLPQLSTIVHECGHFFDLGQSGFNEATYVIREGTQFECTGGSMQNTYARSLITGDAYSRLRPPCNGSNGFDCDSYADIYLDGDPTDATFDSGDQGFDMLLEETVQYVNSLASGYAFADHYVGSVSERDGILTFLWYVERYLKLARESHPETYTRLTSNECWRSAILTVWGRAWLFLDATDGDPALGISDRTLIGLVRDPDLLGEIGRIRAAHGCPQ